METIITLVIWAAVIQGLLLGLIFIGSKKHKSLANKLLGLFLISFVFTALTDLLPFDEKWGYSIKAYFSLPEIKIFIPILFLHFILEKVGKSSKYRLFLKFHYYFGATVVGITVVNIFLHVFFGTNLLSFFSWEETEWVYMFQQYYAFLLTIGVLLISIKETLIYRNLVKNEYSDMALLDINWLWQCIFAIMPVIIFWGAELLRILMGGLGQSELTIVTYFFIVIFIYFVSYKAFTRQTLFDGSSFKMNAIEPYPKTNSNQEEANDTEICAKISREMEQRASYLNQNLTLHTFAKDIQVSARVISTCINQNLGLNFNEWVNNYRVDKALRLIRSDSTNQFSIEGIGMDSGFKSRSAMYAAFKKKLGHSPGHFR